MYRWWGCGRRGPCQPTSWFNTYKSILILWQYIKISNLETEGTFHRTHQIRACRDRKWARTPHATPHSATCPPCLPSCVLNCSLGLPLMTSASRGGGGVNGNAGEGTWIYTANPFAKSEQGQGEGVQKSETKCGRHQWKALLLMIYELIVITSKYFPYLSHIGRHPW